MQYKGHEYEVKFNDPAQQWGAGSGFFRINSTAGDTGEYYLTYKDAIKAAEAKIDLFISNIPQNLDEWIDAIKSCATFGHDDDFEIDKSMALDLLKKVKTHFKD